MNTSVDLFFNCSSFQHKELFENAVRVFDRTGRPVCIAQPVTNQSFPRCVVQGALQLCQRLLRLALTQ